MMCFDELDYMQDCEKGVAGEEINFFFFLFGPLAVKMVFLSATMSNVKCC